MSLIQKSAGRPAKKRRKTKGAVLSLVGKAPGERGERRPLPFFLSLFFLFFFLVSFVLSGFWIRWFYTYTLSLTAGEPGCAVNTR